MASAKTLILNLAETRRQELIGKLKAMVTEMETEEMVSPAGWFTEAATMASEIEELWALARTIKK